MGVLTWLAGSKIGRYIAVSVAFTVARLVRDWSQRRQGAAGLRSQQQAETIKQVEVSNEVARTVASDPDPIGSLHRRWGKPPG